MVFRVIGFIAAGRAASRSRASDIHPTDRPDKASTFSISARMKCRVICKVGFRFLSYSLCTPNYHSKSLKVFRNSARYLYVPNDNVRYVAPRIQVAYLAHEAQYFLLFPVDRWLEPAEHPVLRFPASQFLQLPNP